MKLSFTTVWAITATAAVLVLAGMHLERAMNSVEASVAPTPDSTVPGGAAVVDTYQVPEWLINAPKEWRTEIDGSRSGYALLLDYDRRELLIDACRHDGFFNKDTNLPVDAPAPHCDRVLTSNILEFNDDGMIVVLKDGSSLNVAVAPVTVDDKAMLTVEFDRAKLKLIPGQTNDLIVDITDTPEMKAEFEQYFNHHQQSSNQQRALANTDLEDHVPRFTVPAEVAAANEAQREADRLEHGEQ